MEECSRLNRSMFTEVQTLIQNMVRNGHMINVLDPKFLRKSERHLFVAPCDVNLCSGALTLGLGVKP